MSADQPNIVFFFWDNFGWVELGCYGGGVLRGAPTPRIDALASQGLKLLNFNVEAQCTPSRSSTLTGRHAIRSGTGSVALAGGDGLTRWEITIAQALSDAGYATGMWGKWHLGSDPEQRSPVVSARRMKALRLLLPPDTSMALCWAEGPLRDDSMASWSAPASEQLILRFESVAGGTVLEV